MRANWLFCLMVLGLTGCALPDKPRASVTYDFGPGITQDATKAASPLLAPIVLGEVEANPALDGTALLYRLAYADAQALLAYAQARWSMPPAQLLRLQARTQLAASRPMLAPGETVPGNVAPRLLRLELEEFSQVFESPSVSRGLVRLRATVTQPSAQGEKLLAQRLISAERAAPSSDAPGGVRALTGASQAAVAELDAWLSQLP